MGEHLLRLLMVVCTLGAEWKDPEKIPVKDFINIWRSQSKSKEGPLRGRDLEGTHAEVALAGPGGGNAPADVPTAVAAAPTAVAAAPPAALAALPPTAMQADGQFADGLSFLCSSHRCWRCTACCCPDCSRTCRHRLG